MRALILSGGGARGAYEAGVIASLVGGEPFDIFCGTSIGAVNAAMAAQGDVDRLGALWHDMGSTSVVRLTPRVAALQRAFEALMGFAHAPLAHRGIELVHVANAIRKIGGLEAIFKTSALFDPEPIDAFLRRHLTFAAVEKTLIVTATDLAAGKPTAFHRFCGPSAATIAADFMRNEPKSVALTEESYVHAVRASAAIPIAFAPVFITGEDGTARPYVDGGLGNNSPIRQAIDAGATEITLVLLEHPALDDECELTTELAGIGMTSFAVTQRRLLELDLKLVRILNDAVRRGAAPGYREVAIRTISPSVPLRVPMLGFERQALLDEAFDIGLADGAACCDLGSFFTA